MTSGPPVDAKTLHCRKGQSCDVKVFVKCILLFCTASVDHVRVVVEKGHNGAVIRWELQDPHYKFAVNGIEFVTPPLPPDGEFHNCRKVGPADTRFQCIDRNTTSGEWKYNVNVIGVRTLDPWVMNE